MQPHILFDHTKNKGKISRENLQGQWSLGGGMEKRGAEREIFHIGNWDPLLGN